MNGRTALLSVDLQRDYLARPGLVPDRMSLVAECAALLSHARTSGWTVVHVRTEAEPGHTMPHRIDHPEVIAGSAGAEPPSELEPRAGEALFVKRFFDPFEVPGLEAHLRTENVERIVLMGVHTHACVRQAATSAYARGFEVAIADKAIGSDAPAEAELALNWMDRRTLSRRSLSSLGAAAPTMPTWAHQDPRDTQRTLFEIEFTGPDAVREIARSLKEAQPDLAKISVVDRQSLLLDWHARLTGTRERWVDALITDVAKPRRDAEAEVDYGLALLAAVAESLTAPPGADHVRVHPHGLVGLITPWNNPFAIPIGKLAPAIGFGNCALWKPALPGGRIAALLSESLNETGLGGWIGLVQGASAVGHALLTEPNVSALSFTGSAEVGRHIIATAGLRPILVQTELGGSNAAIIDETADLAAAAADLAAAIFSFSGQRCTAIRRLVVLDSVRDDFMARLVVEVEALTIGDPADSETAIGPIISKRQRERLLAAIHRSSALGARIISGGTVPEGCDPYGCWLAPTLIADIAPNDPLITDEQFGPVCAILRARDLDEALALHNQSRFGLVGAFYSTDPGRQSRFLAEADAGILSINRARPAFSTKGPFVGWKGSGFGPPEHGAWNRAFYTRTQAVYGA